MTLEGLGSDSTINASRTTLEIVEALAEEPDQGPSSLAERLGVSKSTVHNHLRTLVAGGYLVTEDGTYHLGLKFLSLGDTARRRYDLYQAGKHEVDNLVEEVSERAQLMVEEDGMGVYVYQAKTDDAVQTDSHIGTRTDLHATAVGKAYLAFLAEPRRSELLDALEYRTLTNNTITDRGVLEEDLSEIRERGYAYNDEERIVGMRAVGAPVKVDDGPVLGSLSVSGPTTRMNGDWYRAQVPEMVVQAAKVIAIKTTYS